MNENEIIKALECCFSDNFGECEYCPLKDKQDAIFSCMRIKQEIILDLINRQQAEIEKLQHEILSCNTKIEVLQEVKEQLEKDVFNAQMNCDSIAYDYELLKQEKSVVQSEAIKEFAERLKEISDRDGWTDSSEIDNLVNEMTEPVKIEHNSLCETETYIKE